MCGFPDGLVLVGVLRLRVGTMLHMMLADK